MERAVVRAVARLPEDVREFALDRCRFLSAGHILGHYVPGSTDERLVIGGLGARVGYAVCPTGCSASTAVAGSLPFVTAVFAAPCS